MPNDIEEVVVPSNTHLNTADQTGDVGIDESGVGVCGYVGIYYVYKRSIYIRYTDVRGIGRSPTMDDSAFLTPETSDDPMSTPAPTPQTSVYAPMPQTSVPTDATNIGA